MLVYNTVTDDLKLFIEATKLIKTIRKKPTNDELLLLYSLYKQATVGNNKHTIPFIFNFREKAKWDAWSAQSNKSKSVARDEYVVVVGDIVKKYGLVVG